jgi:hypothetical protein
MPAILLSGERLFLGWLIKISRFWDSTHGDGTRDILSGLIAIFDFGLQRLPGQDMLRPATRTGHADGLISAKKLLRLALENRQYKVRNAVVIASALEAELSPLEQRKFHILI